MGNFRIQATLPMGHRPEPKILYNKNKKLIFPCCWYENSSLAPPTPEPTCLWCLYLPRPHEPIDGRDGGEFQMSSATSLFSSIKLLNLPYPPNP